MDIDGKRLQAAIKARGITQLELSNRIGISWRLITAYVNDRSQPRFDGAVAIARELDCSLDWLCGHDPSGAPERCDYTRSYLLEKARTRKNISYTELRENAYITSATFQDFVTNRRSTNLSTAVLVADYLGVSLDDIAGLGAFQPDGLTRCSDGQ